MPDFAEADASTDRGCPSNRLSLQPTVTDFLIGYATQSGIIVYIYNELTFY